MKWTMAYSASGQFVSMRNPGCQFVSQALYGGMKELNKKREKVVYNGEEEMIGE